MGEQLIELQITSRFGSVQAVEVETSGFVGQACTAATAGLEKALGGVAQRKNKPESDTPVAAVRSDQGAHLRI